MKEGKTDHLIACSLFLAMASLLWVFARYTLINYHEAIQLFRTTPYYFESFIKIPGGFSSYLGSFFIQFYKIHWLGAAITSALIVLVGYLIRSISLPKGKTNAWAFLAFIPGICLFFACFYWNEFSIKQIIAIILSLSFFRIYQLTGDKLKPLVTPLLYLFTFFTAGGNAVLFAALVVIAELMRKQRSYVTLLTTGVLAVAVPYAAYYGLYVAPLRMVFFSQTPLALAAPKAWFYAGWLAIPAVFILLKYMNRYKLPFSAGIRSLAIGLIYISVLVVGTYTLADHRMNAIQQAAYLSEQGDWDGILAIRDFEDSQDDLVRKQQAYLTSYKNIALSEKGELASKLFSIPQVGTFGLFLYGNENYLTSMAVSDVYYYLGFIQESEHNAFESMIKASEENGSRAMRRLVQTSMIKRNEGDFYKYIKQFEAAPLYRAWAKKQREEFSRMLGDPGYSPAGMPALTPSVDIMATFSKPPVNLMAMLELNRTNRKVFEYVTCYLLLFKDLIAFQNLMVTYAKDMQYEELPRYLQEALLIYAAATQDKDDVFGNFRFTEPCIQLFNRYNEDVNRYKVEVLREKYNDTYYQYYKHASPLQLENARLFEPGGVN